MRSSSSLRGGADGGLDLVRAQHRYRRIARRPVDDKAVSVRLAHQRQAGAARMGAALGAAGDMELGVGVQQRSEPARQGAGGEMPRGAAGAADAGTDAAAGIVERNDEGVA